MLRSVFTLAVIGIVACGTPEPRCQDKPPTPLYSLGTGDYTLTMQSAAGSVVHGFLTLMAPDWGWADITPATVGAVIGGSLQSQDPEAPGVRVLYETDATFLRFGSFANGPERLFDGAYTVLELQWQDRGSFGGSWRSAAPPDYAVAGFFCVTPIMAIGY